MGSNEPHRARTFPQTGGCLCGAIRYELSDDPVMVYACHCTDCQRENGSSFALMMVVKPDSLRFTQGEPAEFSVVLGDGREKGARYCPRCVTKLGGHNDEIDVSVVDPGTLDDTSWVVPAAHIWTRSAQPWVAFNKGALLYEKAPSPDDMVAIVRAWKASA